MSWRWATMNAVTHTSERPASVGNPVQQAPEDDASRRRTPRSMADRSAATVTLDPATTTTAGRRRIDEVRGECVTTSRDRPRGLVPRDEVAAVRPEAIEITGVRGRGCPRARVAMVLERFRVEFRPATMVDELMEDDSFEARRRRSKGRRAQRDLVAADRIGLGEHPRWQRAAYPHDCRG